MRKTILFLLFLCPMAFYGQDDAVVDIVGAIGGNINVSVLGGAVYSIPLDIPQGVNGMQPEIGIVYNSQGGNGLLGYGWNISGISTITRTGSTLFHDGKMTAANLSTDDQFMLDGQRLISVGSSGNNYEFKTENDEFSKIIIKKENGYYSKCEVRLENGNIIKYGYTANSKLMASDGNNVIKWMVSSVEDRSGNTVSYTYTTYGTDSDLYISSISYTSNSSVGLNAQFTLSFSYLSAARFDHYHYYIAGDKVLCDRLLTGIDVIKGNETIVSYGFTYAENNNSNSMMYNLLTEISLSKGNYEMQPTIIQWNTDDTEPQNNDLHTKQINKSLFDNFTFVGDFNGDGYSDLLAVPYKENTIWNQGYAPVKVYLNNRHGEFGTTPSSTFIVPDSLEWIHVFDINSDGYDDIVLQTLRTHSGSQHVTYSQSFVVYESQQGSGFSNVASFYVNDRLLVRVGDFFGEGRNGLLLIRIIADEVYNNYNIFGYPAIIRYDNGYAMCDFADRFSDVDDGIIVTGDFKGDGVAEFVTIGSNTMWTHHLYKQNGQYRMSTTNDYFDNDDYSSYYAGDFNGDGKDDLLFNDSYLKYIALSTGEGFTDWLELGNYHSASSTYNWYNIVFPTNQTYIYSLNNVAPDAAYGLNVVDLDGDGKSDIMFYDNNHHPIFFRDFNVTGPTTPECVFKIDYIADDIGLQFKNQYFTMGNFFGEDHVSFIAVDPQNPSSATDDKVKVFSFPSTSERFSVGSITDGMGKTIEIEYDYLMPGQPDFYSFANRPFVNDVKPLPMPMAAMKSYTECIGQNRYKTRFKYSNALIHRTGRGFVNFEEVEKTTLVNNAAVKLEKSRYELTTMGINAMALPQCDSTFLYNAGNKILTEANAYSFQNVKCRRQSSSSTIKYIVRPALLSKKTKRFSPDTPGQLIGVEIAEYAYNYLNGNTYNYTYWCNKIKNGANGTECNSVDGCEYRDSTQITYKSNNTSTWVINRKSEEITVAKFSTKPAITRKTKYDYATGNPFLVSVRTDIPGPSDNNPLTVRHTYQYDGCGNVVSETVSAPYGTHNEAPVTTSYTYSNHRLVATKSTDPNGLAYQEQYSYDKYDRVTSHTGSNGLTTTYTYNNTFGTASVKTAPGNVTTTEYLGWAAGEDLAPANALYYKYSKTTGSPASETFYDAGGNAVRTLTVNYELEPVIADVQYNDRQLPSQQSYPYMEGDTPLWTTFLYDGLGRLTSTATPDGTVTSNVYNGLTTTTIVSSGNSTRTASQTANHLGWVTSSTDAGNATVSYTYYSDGKIATMTTSGGNVTVSVAYDDAGNRTSLNDADYGQTTSVYDAYGRLVQQTTPKGDNSYYTYDVLGRITQKTVPSDTTTTSYQYNESTHKGTLASVTHNGQLMQYAYDSYDRLTTVTETRSDTTYTTSYTYNNNSQISSKTYPSGYKVFYGYFSNGTKKHVKDINGNTLWKTNRINPSGQLLRATTGNSAVTNNRYDAATNRLTGSVTSNGIQNFAYTFDGFGNLTSRTDSIGTVKTETFTYDNLDRLTGITLNNVSSTIVYDSYGRMTSKQKDGSTVFSSAQFSQHKPHATRSVSTTSIEFPQSQSIEYNSLDKVKRLAQDRRIVTFTYGYDGQRMRMTVTDTLTGRTKTKDYVGSCEFVDDNGTKKVYTYLMGPYGVFAMVEHSGGTDAVHYVYKDHLGSWTAITDAAGFVEERLSFDAWGNLRDASTWTSVPSRLPRFDRGFTGHEHLYSFGLINMNGRMYDPLLSSFLSPDNYMQDPTSQQGFNRYAYCMYNPLKYVDPTGERPLGWSGGSTYYFESNRSYVLQEMYNLYMLGIESHWNIVNLMTNSIYTQGAYVGGRHGGSGNHGSGGGEMIGSKAFQKLCEKHGIEPGKPIPKNKRTDAFLKEFQQTFFPDAPMDHVKEFTVEGIDKDYMFYSNNNNGAGRTRPQDNNGIITGLSNVFFNDDYVFNSPEFLFYTMGHELIHVSQFASLAGEPYSLALDNDFVKIIEFDASLWEHTMGNYKNYYLYVPTSDVFKKYQYLYDRVNYINYSWTYELYKFLKP